MQEISQMRFQFKDVRSLAWEGDDLIDLAAGGRRFRPDGSVSDPAVFYAFPFDRAVLSPGGKYAVLYAVVGTKGLVLREGKLLREIDRSYYHAHVYEYPIALARLADGREVLIHCPERYSRLEIEDLESGRRLSDRSTEPRDFFHSRLQVSSDGRYLLSAGWVWHPWDTLAVFDLNEALAYPETLDGPGVAEGWRISAAEVEAAAFVGDDEVLIAAGHEEELLDDEPDAVSLLPRELGRWSLSKEGWVSRCAVSDHVGTLMPAGDHVVGFYDHPKLFDVRTGSVLQAWPDLKTGRQTSSIIWNEEPLPPLALDSKRKRFAVADADGVTVIQLG